MLESELKEASDCPGAMHIWERRKNKKSHIPFPQWALKDVWIKFSFLFPFFSVKFHKKQGDSLK